MNKKNKIKKLFEKLSSKKDNKNLVTKDVETFNNERTKQVDEEEIIDNDYIERENLRVNQSQIIDYSNNKNEEASSSLLNSLSLVEMQILEKELNFNYDMLDYKILEVTRGDGKISVSCEITTNNNVKKRTKIIFNKPKSNLEFYF